MEVIIAGGGGVVGGVAGRCGKHVEFSLKVKSEEDVPTNTVNVSTLIRL